jgi:ABC-type antimicrobial peptide transport system permease subunit
MGIYATVINHELWSELAEAGEVNHVLAFNLRRGNQLQIFNALKTAFLEINNLPEDAWDSPFGGEFSRLRPLSHTERFNLALRINGFMLFVVAFLGLIFLISTFVVLYHKFVSDVDDESESISMYKKIGLTMRECRAYIQTHLGIVFFFPLVLGGVLAILLITMLFETQQAFNTWHYMRYIFVMYGGILLFNAGLYAALRKRFFRTVGV